MSRHSFRVLGKLCWLAYELTVAALKFLVLRARREYSLKTRAFWLQQTARRVARLLNLGVKSQGPTPKSGLLICNHLGYLDILVLCALAPCIFVAKREVKGWLVFGWFASLAGTIFINRTRRTDVGRAVAEIQNVLNNGVVLVLFPEGTSSGGNTVLPFKSSLLEPAIQTGCPITAGFLQYRLEQGDVAEEVCYWKDMVFLSHFLNLLAKQRIDASVRLTIPEHDRRDRKTFALHLHREVVNLACSLTGLS